MKPVVFATQARAELRGRLQVSQKDRCPEKEPRKIIVLRRLLAIALCVLAASPAAHGQALPFPTGSAGEIDGLALLRGGESQLLPVVSRSDGRIEALLLLDTPPAPLNPLDRLLAPGTARLGAAARVRMDGGNAVDAALMLDRGPALALLCNQSIGLATTLASLSEHCLLAPLGRGEHDALLGSARASQFEAGWRSEQFGVDLSFGLSWLDSGRLQPYGQDASSLPALSALFAPGQFALAAPELAGARLLSRGIGVRGLFDLGSQRWLSVGGALSRNRIDPGFAGALGLRRFDSSALSVGVGQGNLYGELTGHVAEVPGSDAFWGGVDLGISWRTPWDAQLTVGARNLISHGSNPWLGSDGAALDEGESRVPYVRYKQDL